MDFLKYNIIKNSKRVFFHLLFWFLYLAFYTFQGGYYRNDYMETFLAYIYYLPILLAATYFTNYFIVPRYLLKAQYLKFVVVFIISLMAFVLLFKLEFWFIIAPKFYPAISLKSYYSAGFFYPTYLMSHTISIYYIVFLFGFIKLTKRWFINQQINQKLVQENLEAELKFLKAQMNPHFLFNVLNSLYALALKKSDRTPEMILKLSSMLDFILYESNVKYIPLEKEIKLVNDYVELEKLRYGLRLNFEFNIIGTMDNIKIAPLIIFPFIENSFKHGVSTNLDNPWIKINLNIQDSFILLTVANSKSKIKSEKNSSHSEGIGLTNVKRRLDLIYAHSYELNIVDEDNKHSVYLNLSLNNKD
ncbi:MAG: histidine kinase [bacterium]